MHNLTTMVCDGCGQSANPEHIARRLKRLEKMTRYRPVHVGVLFLGAVSPVDDAEYIYSAESAFLGRGAQLLQALGVEFAGRAVGATLVEFQRRGYLLAHVLECAEENSAAGSRRESLQRRMPATIAGIRRSFKPKRVVLLGGELTEMIPELTAANLDASLLLRAGKPFEWNEIGDGELARELTAAAVQAL